MKIHYDIEKFVIEEMFNPFSPTYDHRCWEKTFGKTAEKRKQGKIIYDEYVKVFKKHPSKIITELENRPEWKELVFKRLSMCKFKFYKHLTHPIIDYVLENVETA